MNKNERYVMTDLDVQVGETVWATATTIADTFPTFIQATVTKVNVYEHMYFNYPSTWEGKKQVTLELPTTDIFQVDVLFKEKDLAKCRKRLKQLLKEKREYLSTEIVAMQNKCSRFKVHHEKEKERMRYKPDDQ